jgi:upstream activation factor subunit UAF30
LFIITQDPENKRRIRCDEKLKKVFAWRDEITMLEIAGLISPHFLK